MELCLQGCASPGAREAIEYFFQNEAVVSHDCLGDQAGQGGEIAAEWNTTVSPAKTRRGDASGSPYAADSGELGGLQLAAQDLFCS